MLSVVLIDEPVPVVVGSINIDPFSMRKSEEGALVIDDPGLAEALERSQREDLRHSMEIRLDSWRRRGLLDRLIERLTSLFGGLT